MSPSDSGTLIEAREIVDTLHEPLLVLDDDLCVQQANPAFYEIFELSEEETLGVPLLELDDGQWDVPTLRDRLRDVLDRGRGLERFDVDHDFPGIGRRVMRLRARAVHDRTGRTRRILLAIDDITEQRELEERLREHARELRRSNADLEQFAYAASHDLQEPLRMVASYLELLERRYRDELDEEAREFIDYAVDGARRMKSLVNGLLRYSRVGRSDGGLGPVELDDVLDEVLADLARQIDETGAEVTRDPLPRVRGDREQLRRVLQNLVENALTHGGDAAPRIHLSAEDHADGTVRVSVRDHGPGIPPAAADRIFQLFHQLDPHGGGREGTGIGLALCRKIVDRHGGKIWVDSRPGEGAAFRFTLTRDPGGTP